MGDFRAGLRMGEMGCSVSRGLTVIWRRRYERGSGYFGLALAATIPDAVLGRPFCLYVERTQNEMLGVRYSRARCAHALITVLVYLYSPGTFSHVGVPVPSLHVMAPHASEIPSGAPPIMTTQEVRPSHQKPTHYCLYIQLFARACVPQPLPAY